METKKLWVIVEWFLKNFLFIAGFIFTGLGVFGMINSTAYYGRFDSFVPRTPETTFFINACDIVSGAIIIVAGIFFSGSTNKP
jgi:hypothetical protein